MCATVEGRCLEYLVFITLPQGQRTGLIGSGWSQIGFNFEFSPIMYLINLNEPDLNPISGLAGPPGSKFRLIWIGLGPQGPSSG